MIFSGFPTFEKTPMDVTVRAGQTARFDCATTGSPPSLIAWQKDGKSDFPAAHERRMHVITEDDGDVYFIVDVKPADEGLYSCTATNGFGTAVASAYLKVIGNTFEKSENGLDF